MKTFLMIVGGIVVGGLLSLLVAGFLMGFYLRRKMGSLREVLTKLVDQMQFVEMVPPFRVELERLTDPAWSRGQLDEITAVLEQRGFERAGDFQVNPIPAGLRLRLLANEAQGVHAAVYDHGQTGVWLDLITAYRDGRVLTTASMRDHLMDAMPNKKILFYEGAETGWLLDEHLAKRPVGDWIRVTASELPDRFLTKYAEEMDWRGERGGPTVEEIARIAERDGTDLPTEMADAIRDAWQTAFHEHRTRQLREAFGHFRELSPDDMENGALIYNGMPVYVIAEALESLRYLFEPGPDEDDGDIDYDREERQARELADRVAAVGARAAFAELTRDWLGRSGFERLATVESPLPADLYRLPDEDGAADDEDDE